MSISVVNKGNVPIHLWSYLEDVEASALDQLVNVSNLPHIFHHVAVMPDVHSGKGATIGSVIAMKGAICPSAVGVDLGCGMMAVQTTFTSKDLPDNLKAMRDEIEWNVPVGFHARKEAATAAMAWKGWPMYAALPDAAHETGVHDKALKQLGTLGGGNHFIEVCLDTEDRVWVMLHSGSRNIGKRIAEAHIEKAKGLMKAYHVALRDLDLAYLVQESAEFKAYWRDLQWAQDYAMLNRTIMMDYVMRAIGKIMFNDWHAEIPRVREVNCHHNYAAMEHHYGSNVLVTRKGAVRARVGDLGIIPGSMGTKSYIVRGLGNAESFHSCSHGAGRRMSRTQAKFIFNESDLAAQTLGVECRKDSSVVDEIPGAYKQIEQVMENQRDLVEIVATIKQVLCVKG